MEQNTKNSQLAAVLLTFIVTALIFGAGSYWLLTMNQNQLENQLQAFQQEVEDLKKSQEEEPARDNIYENRTLGFQLTLPTEDWYAEGTNDPHIYEYKECYENYRLGCAALEIQSHSENSIKNPDELFNSLNTSGLNPVQLDSLIAGATVIRTKAPGPAEGWAWEYNVFFTSEGKGFLVFTNDESLEDTVLLTFKLLN